MEMTKYKLGDIATIYDGPHATPKRTDNGPVYLGIDAITEDCKINPNEFTFLSEEDYKIWTKRVVPQFKDIVFSYEATLGRYAIIPENFYGCLGRRLGIIRVKGDAVDYKWLYYFFQSPQWKCYIKNHIIKGSTVNRISVDEMPGYEIPACGIADQKKIASVLSALDDKIALNKKMNQKLEAMAKRLYDYWFVQYDFPDKNGHPYKTTGGPMTYNPTLKREIPVGWEVKTLDEYLDCNKYSLTAKSSYDFIQYLDTSSLTENALESLQKYGSQAESPSRAKRIVYANDILYSTVRPQQKHYGIIKNPAQNMIASTGFAILSCKYGSEYNDMFYLFLIQEKNLIKLSAIADSNASSYPSFNPSDLLNLSICLPEDIKTIEPLVKKFSSLFGIIERNQKENQKLTALRDKLLPLLMNGQVSVE